MVLTVGGGDLFLLIKSESFFDKINLIPYLYADIILSQFDLFADIVYHNLL